MSDLDQIAAPHPMALAELLALRRDAERWQFVKTSTGGMKPYGQSTAAMLIGFVFGRHVRNHQSSGWVKDLDAAVDAAMKEPQ